MAPITSRPLHSPTPTSAPMPRVAHGQHPQPERSPTYLNPQQLKPACPTCLSPLLALTQLLLCSFQQAMVFTGAPSAAQLQASLSESQPQLTLAGPSLAPPLAPPGRMAVYLRTATVYGQPGGRSYPQESADRALSLKCALPSLVPGSF